MTDRPPLRLTARDLAILRDLARFGALTAPQLRRRHFPDAGALGTVWNRMRRLCAGGYAVRVPTLHREDSGYLVTARGASAAGAPVLAPRQQGEGAVALRHAAAVADVADALLAAAYPGTTAAWLTERELRGGALAGTLVTFPGAGWPDGVLVTTSGDGARTLVAVEVERTQKAAPLYAPKVAWYRHVLGPGGAPGAVLAKAVWYCATPAIEEAVRRALRVGGAEGLPIRVRPLPTL